MHGFRFVPEQGARAADMRLLLAAAEKRLAGERARRAAALVAAEDAALSIEADGMIVWQAHPVARLVAGRSLSTPRIELHRDLDCLEPRARAGVLARVERWRDAMLARKAGGLLRLAEIARDPQATPALRQVTQAVEAAGGIAERLPLRGPVEALAPEERRRLRAAGLTIGALDLFMPALLKHEGARWRRMLLALRDAMLPIPPEGATVLPRDAPAAMPSAGFRPLGLQAVRIDLVERIARAAHEARKGRAPFAPDPALAQSMGLEPATLDRLMVELGFKGLKGDSPRWVWRGRPPARPQPVVVRPGNAFAELAGLVARG